MSTFSNVKSKLVDGKLIFYSKLTGEEIVTFDPTDGSEGLTINDVPVTVANIVSNGNVDGLSGLRVARFTFDPSAVAGQRTIGAHVLGAAIPDNALILYGIVEILTTFADGVIDAATIALSVEGANDLITATAISSGTFWDAVKAKAVVPDALRLAGIATAVKLSAARQVTATVGGVALTAGKLVGWLFYVEGE